jgi:SnoaL-like domain
MSNEPGTGSRTTSDTPVSDADYVQLCRLVTEHAWRTDNGRSDTLHELWAEDGELDLGSTTLRGREAIAEWGRQLIEHPPWLTIHHVCGNMRFIADGPDAATGSTILIVFMDPDGTRSSVPFNVGEDHDRFVRTEDGWRFMSRQWVELYERGDTIDIP